MKTFPLCLVAALALGLAPVRADLLLQPHDFVAICGDSITEQKQYSVFMEDYFLMCQPAEKLRSAQFGWGGEIAGSFGLRIGSDVLPFKPTVVTTCYGMNDGHYQPMQQSTGDAYRHSMIAVVEKLKKAGVRTIVVGSPGVVDGAAFVRPGFTADEYNKTLDALRGIAQEVAQKEGVAFADVYTPMMDVMTKAKAAYGESYQLVAGGGIHPNNNGHIVMAYAFLKALGCDGAIGTITVDMAAGKAEGTPGQEVISCENGKVDVKSTRYPFCFLGDPDKPDQNTACVLKFFPFNDDLNRYLLVVKGLKGSKAKVTWGKASKEFSADDLAKGINLAAEFLDNPFSAQFKMVDAAVQAQQAQETPLVKFYLHSLDQLKTMAPHSKADFDDITADGMAEEKSLFNAAADLVVPIHHTIQIDPEP